METPRHFTFAYIVHAVYACLILSVAIYAFSKGVAKHFAPGSSPTSGVALIVGGSVMVLFAAAYAFVGWAFWKGHRRAGWPSIAASTAAICAIAFDMVGNFEADKSDWAILGLFAIPITLSLVVLFRKPSSCIAPSAGTAAACDASSPARTRTQP